MPLLGKFFIGVLSLLAIAHYLHQPTLDIATEEITQDNRTVNDHLSNKASLLNRSDLTHNTNHIKTVKKERDYNRLDLRENRQAYYENRVNLPPQRLWMEWKNTRDTKNPNQIMAHLLNGKLLTTALRKQDSQAIYDEIEVTLKNPDTLYQTQEQLATILGRSATPQAISLLLDLATYQQSTQQAVYLEAIEIAANTRIEDRFQLELSPALETVWQRESLSDDSALLNTIALSLARVGSPNGLHLILDTISSAGSTFEALETDPSTVVIAAAQALPSVRNPALVPILAAELQHVSPDLPRFVGSGNALANIGGIEATQALLNWAYTAPDEGAIFAQRWLSKIRDTRSITLLNQSVQNNMIFRSLDVENAVRQVASTLTQ